MTRDELKTFTEGLLDGEPLNDDVFDALATSEKDQIEGLREWEFLKDLDESQSASLSAILLPTNFRSPLYIFVGNDTVPYKQVPKEQKQVQTIGTNVWYLDMKNNVYYLLNGSGIVHFHFLYQTPDITNGGAGPVWPDRFHKLLAYRIAEKAYPALQEERGLAWNDAWRAAGDVILQGMIAWDVDLKKRAIENGLSIIALQG